jgi:hypothetical protein
MYVLGTSDFDAQMSGINILKGDEILRPVYKKTVFRNTDWLLAFLDLLVHKEYTLTLRDENFFSLIRLNGIPNNPSSFHTDFKNAPKRSYAQKPIIFVFLAKNFLVHFLLRSNLHF